jgi:cell division initiation protein
MALTPVEIKHIRLQRTLLGYRRIPVDQLLEDVAASFEDVWRDRADLADKVEFLEQELIRFRELEALLRTTLVSAERASQELREQARRESELVLDEAHAEARAITRRARAEREHLTSEARRIRTLLRAALDAVEADEVSDLVGDVDAGEVEEEREAA